MVPIVYFALPAFLALVLAERACHEIRVLRAAHVNHYSSE